jgi:RHS repeat-associated protein
MIAEKQGTTIRRYFYDGLTPILMEEGGQTYQFQTDHLATPRQMTDTLGNVVWTARLDAYGKVTTETGTVVNNLRFPGQYHDRETGLYYNWHRYYAPELGRYITSDPIGLQGGLNTYAYVHNNPIKYIDTTGLDWQYSQSTGQLTHIDANGNTTNIGAGYAGNGQGVNNPTMQNMPNVGPIPQGTYDIGQQRNSPNTGPGILPLTPQAGTNTYGRSDFQIHGDNTQGNQSASQGCMIFNRNIRNQIGNSVDNVLRVVP